MSKVLIEEQTLYDIGDAIRDKNGSSTTYKPSQMASSIAALPVASANDIGKVIGANGLIEQTARTITENGIYDTTNNNSVTVSVTGGDGGDDSFIAYGTADPTDNTAPDSTIYVQIEPDETVGEYYLVGVYEKHDGHWVEYTAETSINEAVITTHSIDGNYASVDYELFHNNYSQNTRSSVSPVTNVPYRNVNAPATLNLGGLVYLTYNSPATYWRLVALTTVTDGTTTFSAGDTVAQWMYSQNISKSIKRA